MPLMPRYGITFSVPKRYDRVEWYGRGPHESYQDRKSGAEIAVHFEKVGGLVFPYVRPQDNGNRADTRSFTITDADGRGLRVSAVGDPVSFSAWPYTLDDLQDASHDYQLPRRDFNTVFVDTKLHGVGGDNSWGARTHPEYVLRGGEIRQLKLVIDPVTP
jgi:beta-galactosidase